MAAMEAGDVDFPTALLYRLYAAVGDPLLPSEYQGSTDPEDMAAFLIPDDPAVELPEDIRAQIAPWLLRPANPDSAFFGAGTPTGTTTIQQAAAVTGAGTAVLPCNAEGWASRKSAVPMTVWARCTGSYEQDIDAAIAVADAIHGPMTTYMGDPVPDGGGLIDDRDSSIDVYLSEDTACPQENRCFDLKDDWQGVARVTEYGQEFGAPSSGYLVLRRSGLSDPDRFRRTFIHEFFHILQFAHTMAIISGPTGGTDRNGIAARDTFWFVEASAVWAEYHFERKAGRSVSASSVNYGNFDLGFQHDDASLHALVPKLRRYHAYIWPFFMVQEKNEAVIAEVWDMLAYQTDWYGANEAVSLYLPFALHFRDFAVRNINSNVAGEGEDPIPKRYQEFDPAVIFPESRPQGDQWLGPATIEPTEEPVEFVDGMAPLSAHYWHLNVTDEVRRFEFDFAGLGGTDILDVDALLAIRTDGPGSAVEWEHRRLSDPKHRFCRDIPEEDVQEMYLVLSNHEKEQIPLRGHWTVDATEDPCQGYEVTFVRETTGGPNDPTKLTLTAVLEPDEEGEEDGVLEATGRAFGSYLHADFETGCVADSHSGVAVFAGQIIGTNLFVNATATDPLILDYYSGEAPEEGGTTRTERAPLLRPGEQGQGIPSCDAYSKVTQSLTVRPLEPQP